MEQDQPKVPEMETEQQEVQETEQNRIEAIKKLKENSVSKDIYNKAIEENKRLYDALINGADESAETPEVEEKKPLTELRKELFTPKKELTDIEYVTKALELRDRVLEETGDDIFVGSTHMNTPRQEDYEIAERVADVFRECLDVANGQNGQFIAALQSRTNEVLIPPRKIK